MVYTSCDEIDEEEKIEEDHNAEMEESTSPHDRLLVRISPASFDMRDVAHDQKRTSMGKMNTMGRKRFNNLLDDM